MRILNIVKKLNIRQKVLLSLVAAILFVRFTPHAGEIYSRYVYPAISATLSALSSVVSFSLDEWIVIITLLSMVAYPFLAKQKSKRHRLFVEIEIVMWMTVWFYLGWGLNYYRDSFFTRLHPDNSQPAAKPSKADFQAFLTDYTDSLNANYTVVQTINKDSIVAHIKSLYHNIPTSFGLTKPVDYQHPKAVAFNWLYSSVGVLGYMGPFADESHLNQQLLPVQFAYTYAHELAHLLSVSSEAEANYWAYTVCTKSQQRNIRYSGYFGLLPNVYRNARSILNDEEFKAWRSTINPRIIAQREQLQDFWHSQYSPLLADIQDALFNALLKSNKIPDGKANYDQAISMILATRIKKTVKDL